MPNFTLDAFASLLTRTFAPYCAAGDTPHAVIDTTDKGKPVLEFHLPNPHDLRHSISLTASSDRGAVSLCTLWFGQVELTGALDPEAAAPAIETIVKGGIVAIARYKNEDAYDNRRKCDHHAEWLYQMPDDEPTLAAMKEKLATPANLWEKLMGTMTGLFEVYTWESSEIFFR